MFETTVEQLQNEMEQIQTEINSLDGGKIDASN